MSILVTILFVLALVLVIVDLARPTGALTLADGRSLSLVALLLVCLGLVIGRVT